MSGRCPRGQRRKPLWKRGLVVECRGEPLFVDWTDGSWASSNGGTSGLTNRGQGATLWTCCGLLLSRCRWSVLEEQRLFVSAMLR